MRSRIIVWVAVLLVVAACGVILFPVFTKAREYSGPSVQSELKIIYLGIELYAEDNDGRLPPAASWMDSVMPFVKGESAFTMQRAVARYEDKVGPSFFAPVGGLRLAGIQHPESVPLLFLSSTREWNAHGDLSKLAPVTEDRGHYIVLFGTGKVKGMPQTWPNGPITIVIAPSGATGGDKS